jgi:hypothetical protein
MSYKKNIIVATLVFIVTLFTLKSALIVGYYTLFTDDFIENFCVNKDQPELNCDGKCFLSKMLNKSDQQEGRQETIAISLAQLEFIFTPLENANLLFLNKATKSDFHYDVKYTSVFLNTADKPPCLS